MSALGARLEFDVHGDVVHIRMARTVAGRPVFWTGAYLVGDVLVDCGPPALGDRLVRALAGRPLEALVLTHHHEDHAGGAAALARARGLVPRVHPFSVPLLQGGFDVQAYRRLAWGRPPAVAAEPLGAEVRTRTARYEVLPTPGHSSDHVCLFDAERGRLLTGDLFLAERLRYLRADEELGRLIDSLRAMARLPVREVLCAHRGPVKGGVDALRRKSERLDELRGRACELLDRGLGEAEVTRRLVGPEGWFAWISLGHFSARNFVRAVARERRAGPASVC